MNTQNITTSSSFIGAGRQTTPALAVSANPLTASSGATLRRVRTVSGKASHAMLENWKFHTIHAGNNRSELKRVRTVNKKAGQMILNRRKPRRTTGNKHVSPALGVLKKLAALGDLRLTRSGDDTVVVPALPCTPRRSTRLSSPPPLERRKRTRACPLVDSKPVKLFCDPLYPQRKDGKKIGVHVLALSVNRDLDYIPKLWMAASF